MYIYIHIYIYIYAGPHPTMSANKPSRLRVHADHRYPALSVHWSMPLDQPRLRRRYATAPRFEFSG